MEGAAGGAGKRADVRRRLADLAAVERQACVERAEEAFVSADRGNPSSMLRPIQLLAQGVGGKELEALACQWETLSAAQQQQAFGVALMVSAEGTWQAQTWRLQLSQLVAVPSQGERSSPPRLIGGAEQALADTAAERIVGELALAVLAPAGPPQLTILGHLQQGDKMRLGSACTSLRQASLAWFPEVTVEVQLGTTDVASLAAWLERHQAYLHVNFVCPDDAWEHEAPGAEWNNSLMALPPMLLISLTTHNPLRDTAPLATLRRLQSLDLSRCGLTSVPTQVSALTALTRLDLCANFKAKGWQHLVPLTQLQDLNLRCCRLTAMPAQLSALTALTRLDFSANYHAKGWQHLAPLTKLQDLDLSCCNLTAVPAQLSALTALTRLDLSSSYHAKGWQHLASLIQLRDLGLSSCKLTAVPMLVSVLTALTCLKLANNSLKRGWQHLLPLTQLCVLDLDECGLTAVPQQLSALSALTNLNLGSNQLDNGWQHLLPLTQLQYLELRSCGLTAVPQQLSKLTALTCLDLGFNSTLAGGWQHLLPLAWLQDLSLIWCCLTAVPEQLSALMALTSLDLSTNRELAGGWQHLLPLTQLRRLNLERVPLPGGVAPPELAELRCDVAVDWDYDHDREDSGASSPASPDGLSASLGDAL